MRRHRLLSYHEIKGEHIVRPRLHVKRVPIEKTNLICHITPFWNPVWLKTLEHLEARQHLFNGKRIIGIADHPTLIPFEQLAPHFEKRINATVLRVPHQHYQREASTFDAMMEGIQSTESNEAFFYCHSKGAHNAFCSNRQRWRNAMFMYCLTDEAIELLTVADTVGTFRCTRGTRFADGVSRSPWHYAGTFFWARHDAIFTLPNWRKTRDSGFTIEAYIGERISFLNSACTYADRIGRMSKYPFMHRVNSDMIKVELGGGTKPKGDGFQNVDILHGEIKCDFNHDPLPYPDSSVDLIYSSHCFEHVENLRHLFREVVRIAKVGAQFELRVPHENNAMAMCPTHKHVISVRQMHYICDEDYKEWFVGLGKRLRLVQTIVVKGEFFDRARQAFPQLSDEDIMQFLTGTAHEYIYHLYVEAA